MAVRWYFKTIWYSKFILFTISRIVLLCATVFVCPSLWWPWLSWINGRHTTHYLQVIHDYIMITLILDLSLTFNFNFWNYYAQIPQVHLKIGSDKFEHGGKLSKHEFDFFHFPPKLMYTKYFNPLTAKLFNLNFHPLEVVSRHSSGWKLWKYDKMKVNSFQIVLIDDTF